MKHPINSWTLEFVQRIRNKRICIGKGTPTFTNGNMQTAIAKLQTLYSGRVNPSFAEKILLLSELYD